MADDHDRHVVELRHAADDGGIIGKTAVTVHLDKIREHGLDIIQRIRPVRMAGDLDLLPGSQPGVDLGAQLVGLFVELEDLFLEVDVPVRGEKGQFLDLLFKFSDRFFKFKVFLRQIVLLQPGKKQGASATQYSLFN